MAAPSVPLALATVAARRDLGYVGKGGARARVVSCDDDREYIVKLSAGQGPRVLANECLGALLARLIGCPSPRAAMVLLSPEFLAVSPELTADGVTPGSYIGSEKLKDALDFTMFGPGRRTVDRLEIENRSEVPATPVFDNWTLNVDRGNAQNSLLVQIDKERDLWHYYMIDFGHILKGPGWALDGLPHMIDERQLVPGFHLLSPLITGEQPFATYLGRVEAVTPEEIRQVLDVIPSECRMEEEAKPHLLALIDSRKRLVRGILETNRRMFPQWRP